MSLLTIITQVCGRTNIPVPTNVMGSTSDTQILQLVQLLEEEGRDLAARGPWQGITFEATWSTTAAEDQGALAGHPLHDRQRDHAEQPRGEQQRQHQCADAPGPAHTAGVHPARGTPRHGPAARIIFGLSRLRGRAREGEGLGGQRHL